MFGTRAHSVGHADDERYELEDYERRPRGSQSSDEAIALLQPQCSPRRRYETDAEQDQAQVLARFVASLARSSSGLLTRQTSRSQPGRKRAALVYPDCGAIAVTSGACCHSAFGVAAI